MISSRTAIYKTMLFPFSESKTKENINQDFMKNSAVHIKQIPYFSGSYFLNQNKFCQSLYLNISNEY